MFTCSQGLEHEVDVYRPLDLSKLKVIALYLPSCALEKPRDPFVLSHDAHSAVLYPIIESIGGKPNKRQLPDWICEWVLREHACRQEMNWSLLGFSRGASWGLKLITHCVGRGMHFSRVLLVAPYLAGSWDDKEKCAVKTALVDERACKRIMLVWGERDPWPQPELLLDETLKGKVNMVVLPGIGHEEALRHMYEHGWVNVLTTPRKK